MKLLTITDVAKEIQMSEGFVKKAMRVGELKFARFGPRCVRIRPEDLESWVKGKIAGTTESLERSLTDSAHESFQEKSVSYRP